MRKASLGFLLVGLVRVVLFGADTSLQQNQPMAWVDMPQTNGPPDGHVSAAITLTTGQGVQVGSFSMTIRFSSKLLTFQKAEPTGLAEGVGAEVKAEITQEGDEGVVRLTIATPERDGTRAALPQGPLANVQVRVAKDAKPGTGIPVPMAEGTGAGIKPDATVKIETRDGRIVVSDPSVIACFFYMH